MSPDGDFIQINYINTKLAVPDEPNFNEDDYLKWNEESGWLALYYFKQQFYCDRVKGKEYLRTHFIIDNYEEIEDYYIYARRLDESLMYTIELPLGSS